MIGKCLAFARGAMILVTLVTLIRFGVEAGGGPPRFTRFISATVIILAVPLYFGFKAAGGGLNGYGELALASFLFAFWGEVVIAFVTLASGVIQIHTHYLTEGEMATLAGTLKHAAAHLAGGVALGVYAILISSLVYAISSRARAKRAW